jgi:hypothetical protein
MKLVHAAASFALTGTGGSCSAVVGSVSVLKDLSIVWGVWVGLCPGGVRAVALR